MFASVIIPSLNSPIIAQVVSAVKEQCLSDRDEIVVVGRDESGLLAGYDYVRFIDTQVPILAAKARNLGIEAARTDLLIFLDSDCIPMEGWLAAHKVAHKAGHRVVSGSVLPRGRNYWHLVYNLTLFHEVLASNNGGPRDFLATLNLSLSREVIQQVGAMNEGVNRVEDVEWTTRMRQAGIQPYFFPAAAVYHDHARDSLQTVWRDCALSGYHMRRLRLQYQDWLQAPFILRYPRLVWWLSPLIATWATLRILWKRPYFLTRFTSSLPALFVTKVAWCWGASRETAP